MSRNLHLDAPNGDKVELVQTPSRITNEAMKLYDTGCCGSDAARQALSVYKEYIYSYLDDVDFLEQHIARIEGFLALVPGARFTGW